MKKFSQIFESYDEETKDIFKEILVNADIDNYDIKDHFYVKDDTSGVKGRISFPTIFIECSLSQKVSIPFQTKISSTEASEYFKNLSDLFDRVSQMIEDKIELNINSDKNISTVGFHFQLDIGKVPPSGDRNIPKKLFKSLKEIGGEDILLFTGGINSPYPRRFKVKTEKYPSKFIEMIEEYKTAFNSQRYDIPVNDDNCFLSVSTQGSHATMDRREYRMDITFVPFYKDEHSTRTCHHNEYLELQKIWDEI